MRRSRRSILIDARVNALPGGHGLARSVLKLVAHMNEAEDALALRVLVNEREIYNDQIPLGKWEKTLDIGGMELGQQVTVELVSDTFTPLGQPRGDGKGASDDTRALGVQVWSIKLLDAPEAASPR